MRQKQRNHQEEFQGSVTEAIDNIRVVKGFARENEFDKELGHGAHIFANFNLHSHFLASCLRSTTKVIQLASQYLFIIFGAWLVISLVLVAITLVVGMGGSRDEPSVDGEART